MAIRPTSDRVRKALFDILGARVQGAAFLDAFAGTGAVGLEALSRGARRAVFLERDRSAVDLIRQNLRVGRWAAVSEIIAGDIVETLVDLGRRERFSIIFLDPPYDHAGIAALLEAAARLLEPGGILVLEHRASVAVEPPAAAGLGILRSYRHGDTRLTTLIGPGGQEP